MTVHVRQLWGTAITVDLRQECSDDDVNAVFDWFELVDAVFSTWRDDSQINRFQRGELSLAQCAPELNEVLTLSDEVTAETRGAFDIRVGADPRVSPRPGFAPLDPGSFVGWWEIEPDPEGRQTEDAENVAPP